MTTMIECTFFWSSNFQFFSVNIADVNARTKDEDQTPVHFAAKNDACESLKALLSRNCEFDSEVRDYKNRTPLNLAAELGKILFLQM